MAPFPDDDDDDDDDDDEFDGDEALTASDLDDLIGRNPCPRCDPDGEPHPYNVTPACHPDGRRRVVASYLRFSRVLTLKCPACGNLVARLRLEP